MKKTVEQYLKNVLIRNCRAFADDADEYGMTEEEQFNLYGIADRLENGTADEQDWIEAIAQIDCNG